MNKYIIQLAELQWSKVIGIGVVLGVLYYFMLYDDGSSVQASIKAAKDQLAITNKQLSQTEKAIADANRFEKEVKSLTEQFQKITEFMPPTIGAAELSSIINQQAQAAGVHPKIEPKGEDKPNGFYQTSKVDLQIEGTYAQIVTFLSNLSRVPRLMTFDKVQLNQASGGGPLVFSGTLIAYRYLKETPDAQGAKPGTAPAAQPPGQEKR